MKIYSLSQNTQIKFFVVSNVLTQNTMETHANEKTVSFRAEATDKQNTLLST